MNVGNHRHLELVFHLLQDAKAFLQSRGAVGADAGAVGLVVGGLEHHVNVQVLTHLLHAFSDLQGDVFALNRAGAREDDEAVTTQRDRVGDLNRRGAGRHHEGISRCSW